MSFKRKIDKILEVNDLNINSISALEDAIGASRSSLNEFYKSDEEPGRKTLNRLKNLKGLNWDWYTTGIGEPFLKDGELPVNINPESIYRDLVEANSDYRLVPKTILDEEYRIVLKSELDDRAQLWKDAMAAKNALIDQLYKQIDSLTNGAVPVGMQNTK